MRQIKFTKAGLEKIKNDYEDLKNLRPNAVKELSRARELGDLSENGLYHAAKANLRSIDSHIRRLSMQIKLANVISTKKFVVEQNGKEITYEIVGDYEADPKSFKISSNSPIGNSLLRKTVGDNFSVNIPSGELKIKILKIL